MRYKFLSLIISLLFFCPYNFAEHEQDCINSSETIEEKLDCLNNIKSIKEITNNINLPSNIRQFEIYIEQLVNQDKPYMGTFQQKLILLHRNENEPMVLQTSGYYIFKVAQSAIMQVFKTNQLQVEHRFFSNSVPDNNDWSQLNIKQSADDFHAITKTFKKIYNKAWVGTGASKGGMTSTYHRFFYPNDLDGTVADVTPLSFSTYDQRYSDFINKVGGDTYKDCREAWFDMQKKLLANRDLFVPRFKGKYDQLGGADVAYEHAVIESMFFFWQYKDPDDPETGCPALPINTNIQDIYNFVFDGRRLTVESYTDEEIETIKPYYYQAATELGNPSTVTSHLENIRWFKFEIDQYAPKNVELNYSNSHMRAVNHWIKTEADNIIFIYGEFDPWTAGEYPLSTTGKTIYKYYVPKGNHGAKFTALNQKDKIEVIKILSKWLDKKPSENNDKQAILLEYSNKSSKKKILLEDLEFETRKKFKLL